MSSSCKPTNVVGGMAILQQLRKGVDTIETAHQLQGVNSEEGTEDHQSDADWPWTGEQVSELD